MKTRIALAILFALLVGLAVAQVPYHNSVVWRAQQWLPATTPSPLTIAGIANWFSYTNAGAIATRVSHWPDLVSANAIDYEPTYIANSPTNTADGVFFGNYGAFRWLRYNAPGYDYGSNVTFFVICNPAATVFAGLQTIFSDSTAAYGLFYSASALKFEWKQTGINADVLFPSSGTIAPNTFYDVGVVRTGTNYNIFLNGTWATNSTTALSSGSPFDWVGGDRIFGQYSQAIISDIIIYTNSLTTNDISSLHLWTQNAFNNNYISRTNITGFPVVAQFVGDDYTTNGSAVPVWTNRVNTGVILTNLNLDRFWPKKVVNAVNTNGAVVFGNGGATGTSNYLDAVNFSAPAQREFFLVLAWTNSGVSTAIALMDGPSCVGSRSTLYYNTHKWSIDQGSGGVDVGYDVAVTNKWFVMDVVFSGYVTSKVFTNNVSYIIGYAGADAASGLRMSSFCNQGSYSTMQVGEILCFQTNLPTALRTKVYNELKAVYGL